MRHVEATLAELCKEPVGPENAEYFPKMLDMLLRGLGNDEDVIKVHDHILVQLLTEQLVHELLECTGSIG